MNLRVKLILTAAVALFVLTPVASAKPLEIHIINVQQGSSAFVRGPNGTMILIDGGNFNKGNTGVIPYLERLGVFPDSGPIDCMIISHRHVDHFGGLFDLIEAGYGFKKVYDNGSPQTSRPYESFKKAVKTKTRARGVKRMTAGRKIDLGNGASATCVVTRGKVYRGKRAIPNAAKADENDLSVGLLIKYGNFEFLTAGDMGGGQWSEDKECTERKTTQKNVESHLAKMLVKRKYITGQHGIEVLHVNHHGAESSTNSDYMNILSPAVAVISVGPGQSSNWFHPRKAVVENVLMARSTCITAPPALVLQTEEGEPAGPTTSFEGFCVGDVVIETDGRDTYTVRATGNIGNGPDERAGARLPRTIKFDENI